MVIDVAITLGAVGLMATSIWQYRQSQTTRWQAEAQQKVAETQAANSWKIERAEILAKNLQVLASTGANTVDQRYGVLLSLARGNILDPELSVSYALELGKDNPDYMQSVLSNTSDKDYLRLSRSFVSMARAPRPGSAPRAPRVSPIADSNGCCLRPIPASSRMPCCIVRRARGRFRWR